MVILGRSGISLLMSVAALGMAPPGALAAPPPRVTLSISSPASGALVFGSVGVSGTATSKAGLSGVTVAVDSGSPQLATLGAKGSWSTTVDTTRLQDGSHTFQVVATDKQHNSAQASVAVTTSNQAPVVALSSPTAGATISGSTTVSGTASSTAGIAGVQLRVDSGPWQPTTGTTSWSLQLSTTAYASGQHTLSAQATDTVGRVGTASVSVIVDNRTATHASPWYLQDSTGSVSTVNETMSWDGATNQASPLPSGTITLLINDPNAPNDSSDSCSAQNSGWRCVHALEWVSSFGWSLHYAFRLGTEYPRSDTWTVSYSGDTVFAPNSAQAANT